MAQEVGVTQIIVDGDTRPFDRTLRRTEKTSESAGIASGDAFSDGMAQGIQRGSKKVDAQVSATGDRNAKSLGRSGRDGGKRFGDGFWKSARKSFLAPWNALDNDVRLILGAIAVSFSELAALGSGLSAAFTAIAGSVAFAGAGLASFTAVLPGVAYGIGLMSAGLKDVKTLAPEAAAGLDELKRVFEEVDVPAFMAEWESSLAGFSNALADSLEFDTIAASLGGAAATITDALTAVIQSPAWTGFVGAMETSLPAAIGNLGSGFAALGASLLSIFTAAAPVVEAMSEQFKEWGESIAAARQEAAETGELTEFFQHAAVQLNLVLDLIGRLGAGLGSVFGAGAAAGEQLLAIFGMFADSFANWAESAEGQAQLAEWFEQGLIVLSALLPVIVAVSEALASAVTPETVAQLVGFLDSLAGFIPLLGQVLELATQLGVFDIFAQILTSVGEVLTPIMPQLEELANLLGEALLQVVVAITPLVGSLVQVIAAILPAVMAILPPLADLITTLADALTPIIDALTPLIEVMAEVIGDTLASAVEILTPIINILAQALQIAARILTALLVPAVRTAGKIIGTFRDIAVGLVNRALRPVQDWLQRVIGKLGVFEDAARVMGRAIENVGSTIKRWLTDRLKDVQRILGNVGDSFRAFGDWASSAVQRVVDALSRIRFPPIPPWLTNGFGAIGSFFAEGGLVTGPTRAVIGEAGPEMVVPLARPLSQVDPAVRDVAAYAQGKTPAFASGGIAGGGTNIAPGAIQIITPYANPRLVAEETMNALVLAGK